MSTLIVLAALCSSWELPAVVESRVDMLEVNRCFNDSGDIWLEQLIAWNIQGDAYHVVCWRVLRSSGQVPIADSRGCQAVWFDGEIMRRVRARSCIESWTSFDRERADLPHLPSSERRELPNR